ncbi:MAG: glycosyltransferase family 2 protein [Chitinophagia bacterium]|nr:glycosyltransferase family 2 protein [Chitinophagia bacterium]
MAIVSVIIPTYNRKKLLSYTLDSLQSMHHTPVELEIIVVDDGSNDGTEKFVTSIYPYVIYLTNKGKGASAARNTGLKYATSKYVLYLDSDDIIGTDFFQKKVEFLENNPQIGAVYGNYEFFKSDLDFDPGSIEKAAKYPKITDIADNALFLKYYTSGKYIPPLAILWRREILLAINGHDESFIINQDVEMFIRAWFNGLKMVYVEDGTFAYSRVHSTDNRVGKVDSDEKLQAILKFRTHLNAEMRAKGYGNNKEFMESMSYCTFNFWRRLRHTKPEIAKQFLQLAKQTYWPIQIRSGVVVKTLANIIGPDNFVNIKYFFRKRD